MTGTLSLDTILLVLVLFAAVAILIVLLRRRSGVAADELASQLTEQNRELTSTLHTVLPETLAPVRESVERTVREEGERRDRLVTAELEKVRQLLDTRLEALHKANTELADTMKSGMVDLDKRLLQAFADQSEKLTKSFTEARDHQAGELRRSRQDMDARLEKVEGELKVLVERFQESQGKLREEMTKSLKAQGEENKNAIITLQERVAKEMHEVREKQAEGATSLGEQMRKSLEATTKANEEKLEKIRLTVDEKLHETLEKRLGESFKLVSERLELVQKGLGEMQALATDVGGLKRVLTNVRSRGTFGEVQLGALLEQVFTPAQYGTNVATIPGSNERVEYALKMPGRDDDREVWLPIDAKFPVETRERMEQAIEQGDSEAYAAAQKELSRVLLGEAQKIRSKYVSPPHTTDFALMFIPTEGLYAEVLRVPELAEKMHNDHHVLPVGPMNLFAILNSLQMGFRTLALQKRSAEVWTILGAVKTEFSKFGTVLEKVGTHLDRARKQIDQTGVRSRAIERKLRTVEALPATESSGLLDDMLPGEDEDGDDVDDGRLPLDER